MRRWILLAMFPATLAGTAAAQPLAIGGRVRMQAIDSAGVGARVVAGTVLALPPGYVTLQPHIGQSSIDIPLGSIRQVDVSRGFGNHRRGGMLVGGLISGTAFVGLACAFSNGSCSIGDNVGGFAAYYAVGAIHGAIVGGMIGARRRGAERWETVWRR